MKNFEIESPQSSEKFYEPGLYKLQFNTGRGGWISVVSDLKKSGFKDIDYLVEYPISEFELKEIFTNLCKDVDLSGISNYIIKIRKIPYEHKS
jgi:hypothetical protein